MSGPDFPFFHVREVLWDDIQRKRADAREAAREWRSVRDRYEYHADYHEVVAGRFGGPMLDPARRTVAAQHDMVLRAVERRELMAERVHEARSVWREAMPEWIFWSSARRWLS